MGQASSGFWAFDSNAVQGYERYGNADLSKTVGTSLLLRSSICIITKWIRLTFLPFFLLNNMC